MHNRALGSKSQEAASEPKGELQLSKGSGACNTEGEGEVEFSNRPAGVERSQLSGNAVTCSSFALEGNGLDGEVRVGHYVADEEVFVGVVEVVAECSVEGVENADEAKFSDALDIDDSGGGRDGHIRLGGSA